MVVRRIQLKGLCPKGMKPNFSSTALPLPPFNKQLSKLDIFNEQTLELFL